MEEEQAAAHVLLVAEKSNERERTKRAEPPVLTATSNLRPFSTYQNKSPAG